MLFINNIYSYICLNFASSYYSSVLWSSLELVAGGFCLNVGWAYTIKGLCDYLWILGKN